MKCTRPVLERCKSGPIELVERPCGKCPACRATKAQEWTYRLFAERKLHKSAVFLTLTFDDENLHRLLKCSNSGLYFSLDKKILQDFNKRLRRNLSRRIRFYAVGEYGEKTKRPHYHGIYFGVTKDDEKIIKSCWKFGFVYIGDVTPASIAYVARYCVKKLHDDSEFYRDEMILPEFSLQSSKPGIGFNAIQKGVIRTDDGDFCWFQGRKIAVPGYFKKKIRTAYDNYVARLRASVDRDARIADFERSGRVQEDEWLQSERNRLSRIKARQKC